RRPLMRPFLLPLSAVTSAFLPCPIAHYRCELMSPQRWCPMHPCFCCSAFFLRNFGKPECGHVPIRKMAAENNPEGQNRISKTWVFCVPTVFFLCYFSLGRSKNHAIA